MDARKRMYKAGPRDNPTLSERVNRNKNRVQTARANKFAASRQIPLEDSPTTPGKEQNTKVSAIVNRNQKLKAYRLEKNTQKLKEIQEQKSPFIQFVPSGRWVEKKERVRPQQLLLNATPVRAALMNERVLKKSTVKHLITTSKKENVMVFGKDGAGQPTPKKSKKKILTELNAASQSTTADKDPEPLPPMDQEDLNSTFEVSPEKVAKPPPQRLRRSNSLPQIATKAKARAERKIQTPPAQVMRKQAPVKKPLVVKRAVIVKPVPAKVVPAKDPPKILPAKIQVKAAPVKPQVQAKLHPQKTAAVEAQKETPAIEPEEELAEVPSQPEVVAEPEVKRSFTFKLYKSSLDIQHNFLTLKIEEILRDQETFLGLISDEQKLIVQQSVQQGNRLVSESLPKFEKLLEEFEDGLSRENDPKRKTEDDVENYWYLIDEELEKVKKELLKVLEMKKSSLAASQKKRRSRRTLAFEGTPKRSVRIATNADTPKHNASCYGCVTMSATKVNTPKSAKRRTTTAKKSVGFANVETPKRGSHRRSTRYQATPKRNLMNVNADEVDESDLKFDAFE